MTDGSSIGGMDEAPDLHDTGASCELWKALAEDFPEFGSPSVFADNVRN